MPHDSLEESLKVLLNLPVREFGRIANMLWIELGDLRDIPGRKGDSICCGEWSLHTQCPWRLCQGHEIVVGSHDFYQDVDGNYLDDWDCTNKSCFDQYFSAFNAQLKSKPLAVLVCTADDFGGFTLLLENGFRLDVFPNGGGNRAEAWRLFQPGADVRHTVFPKATGE